MSRVTALLRSATARAHGAEQGPVALSESAVRFAIRGLQLGPAGILALVALAFYLANPLFLTERNITNIGVQSAPIVALALGQMLVIIARGIDLSIGSIVSLATVMGALAFADMSTWLVIPVILATGAAVGFANGAIFIFGRIPNPFIVTLAMLYLVAGLALVISKGETLPGMPAAVQSLGNDDVLFIPAPVLLVAALAVLMSGLTRRTKLGRWIYAVGGSPEAAARVGIPVGGVQIATYVLSGLCAAIAAVVIAGRTNSGYPTAGEGLELDVIAAVIVGGTSIFGGRGSVGGVVIGALLLGVIRNGLNLLDVSPFWQLVVIGAIILAAVTLDVLRARLEVRFQLLQARRLEA